MKILEDNTRPTLHCRNESRQTPKGPKHHRQAKNKGRMTLPKLRRKEKHGGETYQPSSDTMSKYVKLAETN